MEHELGEGHGSFVLWGVGVQRGHLRVEHELGGEHGLDVFLRISVQRGHLRMGHELCEVYAVYV